MLAPPGAPPALAAAIARQTAILVERRFLEQQFHAHPPGSLVQRVSAQIANALLVEFCALAASITALEATTAVSMQPIHSSAQPPPQAPYAAPPPAAPAPGNLAAALARRLVLTTELASKGDQFFATRPGSLSERLTGKILTVLKAELSALEATIAVSMQPIHPSG